jgi:hypothetical protein
MNLTDSIPGGTYLTATSKITSFTTLSNHTVISTITDGTISVAFSDTVQKGKVPATFATWGSPPATESSTPPVLETFNQPNPVVRTLDFSLPVTVFGVEAEGVSFSPDLFEMDFYSDGILEGSISEEIDGEDSARILGGYSSTPFDSVVITDETAGDSFAIAQVRYAAAINTPEPQTAGLMLLCLTAILFGRRAFSREPRGASMRC